MNKFLLIVLAFLLGTFFATAVFYVKNAAPPTKPVLIDKLQVLTDTELVDYYNLKDQKAKYEKADEILGKIVLLLLTDIGLKISPDVAHKAQLSTEEKKSEAPPATFSERAVHEVTPHEKPKLPNWLKNEEHLMQISTSADADRFLDDSKIGDFDEALKASISFQDHQNILTNLNGVYSGQTQISLNGTLHNWDILIDLSASLSGGALNGKNKIVLSENGKAFSTMSDNGGLHSLKELPNSQTILMRVSPTKYFQVYYLKVSDELIANIYHRQDDEHKYQYIGWVELKRK